MNFALCEKKINAGLEQGTAVNRRCSNSKLADAKFKEESEKKAVSKSECVNNYAAWMDRCVKEIPTHHSPISTTEKVFCCGSLKSGHQKGRRKQLVC